MWCPEKCVWWTLLSRLTSSVRQSIPSEETLSFLCCADLYAFGINCSLTWSYHIYSFHIYIYIILSVIVLLLDSWCGPIDYRLDRIYLCYLLDPFWIFCYLGLLSRVSIVILGIVHRDQIIYFKYLDSSFNFIGANRKTKIRSEFWLGQEPVGLL